MAKHEIYQFDLYAPLTLVRGYFETESKLIDERHFKTVFTKNAYKWFDNTIKQMYPQAVKIEDTTLAGYHWEFEKLWWELQ